MIVSMSTNVGELEDGNDEEGIQNRNVSHEPWRREDLSNVRFLVRPALPGRKSHRSWYREVTVRRQEANRTEQESESSSNSDRERGNLRRTSNVDEASNARSLRTVVGETGTEDAFWVEVRSRQVRASQSLTEDREREEEEDAGEGGSGVMEVQGPGVSQELLVTASGAGDRRSSRREKNRARCLRRRQRKRRQQQQENQQVHTIWKKYSKGLGN